MLPSAKKKKKKKAGEQEGRSRNGVMGRGRFSGRPRQILKGRKKKKGGSEGEDKRTRMRTSQEDQGQAVWVGRRWRDGERDSAWPDGVAREQLSS